MKVLICQTRFGIGDCVIFLPYIHAIAKRYGPVTLLAKKSSRANEICKYDKNIKEILFLERDKEKEGKHSGIKGFFNLAKEIKHHNFDIGFIFNSSLRYSLIFKLAKIKKIYQYPLFRKKDNIFLSAKIFTESVLNEVVSTQPEIKIEDSMVNATKEKYNINNSVKNICLGLSASGDTKRWGVEKYLKICEKINKQIPSRFFLAGGKDDQNLINHFLNSPIKDNCFSFEKMSISETLPIIKNCNLYLGNDTGWLHLSSALNIKCIALFMDSPALSYGKYSKNINIITPEGFTEETTTHDTLGKDKIDLETVYNKTIQVLAN